MNKIFLSAFLFSAISASAAIPAGYYDSLDGKQGAALADAIRLLAADHSKVSYGEDSWAAFEKTDMRIVNGRQAWWDMYSNNLVYLPDHGALNIEHSVAKSWWNSEKNLAYADLFHLNPSDQNANNKKGNYPPGEVTDARLLDNGITRIGTPVAGQGGGSASVFEPADEYKGDFARAYFYIFSAYPDLAWQEAYAYVYDASGALQPWAAEMLLRWHEADPVDSKELNRNEEIFSLQGNRNPFIDYPDLAMKIYGDDNSSFSLSSTLPAVATDRPEAPRFDGCRVVGVNTYARRWWDGYQQTISAPQGRVMVSLNGGEWFDAPESLDIDPASSPSSTISYRAYAVQTVNGHELRSPVASLSLAAISPDGSDLSQARWQKVETIAGMNTGVKYILLSSNTLHAMSARGGSSASQFMESAGFVEFDADGNVIEIPADAALIEFAKAEGSDGYSIIVDDTRGNFLGFWNASAKNKMRLDPSQYKTGSWNFSNDGAFRFTFSEFGTLQFNKTQPRFLQYESNQTPVFLYRFLDMEGGSSDISAITPSAPWGVTVTGHSIIAPEDASVFDLNGRRVQPFSLAPGIYIVTGSGHSTKIIIN